MNLELKTFHKITNEETGEIVADRLTKKELDTFFRCPSNFNNGLNKYQIDTYYRNRFWKLIDKIQHQFVMSTLVFLLAYLMYNLINELI
jgi:hypothetical protein